MIVTRIHAVCRDYYRSCDIGVDGGAASMSGVLYAVDGGVAVGVTIME